MLEKKELEELERDGVVGGRSKIFRLMEEKITAIKRGIKILEKMFKYAKQNLRPQITEKQLANNLRKYGRSLGVKEKWPFSFIVAFGPNAAKPHHKSAGRKLGKNDLAKIDLGVRVNSYCTDCTRTFFIGRPIKKFIKIYQAVLKAQKKAIGVIKEGVPASYPDKKARLYLKSKRLGKYFIHGTGHGVSKSIHCHPYLKPKQTRLLKVGDIVTVEPGVYIKNCGGVRIEDMVLVRKKGCKILTGNISKILENKSIY